ncbi:MAG: pimeloyl-ACP methyl ester carboxylesterase [Patiriisocius sp.]|jgi:pimeloyl-ACP methyl ester carboxylesterase
MKKIIVKSIGFFLNTSALVAPEWSADYAFNLLGRVRRTGISEKGKKFFKQATQHNIELKQHTAVLHQWGNGPKKILFLHGWESNSQRWLPYYNLLKKEQYTVYALDAPGHGMSPGNQLNIALFREAIEAAIRHVGTVDTVVCHSLSNTAMGYSYLMNASVQVNKFIVMGAPSGMDAVFVFFKEILGLSMRCIRNLNTKVDAVLKIPHKEITLSNFLERVTQPVLVIHDKNDAVTPFEPIKKALSKNPKITSFITTGLKHDLKGDTVYNKVIAFINA